MRAISQHAAAPFIQVRGAVSPNRHRQISRQRSGRRLGCLGVVVVCSNTLTREARQKKIRCKPMHFRSVRRVTVSSDFDRNLMGMTRALRMTQHRCGETANHLAQWRTHLHVHQALGMAVSPQRYCDLHPRECTKTALIPGIGLGNSPGKLIEPTVTPSRLHVTN